MWDALAVAFVWGVYGAGMYVIRRMISFRYNPFSFCDSLVFVETPHDVGEEQY